MKKDVLYTRITLRIPRDIHKELATFADQASKSMNAEIIERLRQTLLPTETNKDSTLRTLIQKMDNSTQAIADVSAMLKEITLLTKEQSATRADNIQSEHATQESL